MLLVFGALALAPPGWAIAGIVALGVVTAAIGGARLVAARRAHAAARAAGADGVALGVDGDGRPVVLSDWQLSAHALIVGASGAGKSTTLLTILTDHIRRGRPVVAIDMKGSPRSPASLRVRPVPRAARSSCGRWTGRATGTRSATATRPSSRTS